MSREDKIRLLADIIFDAAKYGYMPYDTDDDDCAMKIAEMHIDDLLAE